nr:luciferase [Halarchaeum solikamskense]
MECDVSVAADLPFDTVVIDYEGRAHLPESDVLADIAARRDLRLTTPVRAAGFDPLGDDELAATLPEDAGRVLVAGHGAYLDDDEQEKRIAPRLGAAVEAYPDAWVGTEGIERVALATGAGQFELLSRSTDRDLRALRVAGYEGQVSLYAPVVLDDDEEAILDALGDYTARRGPVRRALPDDAATDGSATGRAREVLSAAVRDYALVGDAETVGERVAELKDAGADTVVGYPARGPDAFR